jgi:Cu/Ag efflux protein CusF
MQKVAVLAAVLFVFACAKAKENRKPLSEPGEKVYSLRGVIVGRDVDDNTLRVDHEEIPGYMEAMTMDYPVRGAAVGTLPSDKTRVQGRLHVHDDQVWLTDVRRAQ